MDYDTTKVCKLLGVSRSNYYKQRTRNLTEKRRKDEQLVIQCFKDHHGRYGRIRIRKALLEQGCTVSEYQIARVLEENGLIAKSGRKRRHYANRATEQQCIEENLIQNKTSVTEINYLWCADITELKYASKEKLFLAGVIDVASRRLIGWAIGKRQTKELVQDAFRMAVGRNPIRPRDAVFHSDRGVQYTALSTKTLIESSGFRKSMSRPGTPHDNQPIESFWRTLEVEMPDIRHLNFEEACRSIVAYIECYYNPIRLHSSLNYLSPNTFFSLSSVHLS